jgi:hypothetical protein
MNKKINKIVEGQVDMNQKKKIKQCEEARYDKRELY